MKSAVPRVLPVWVHVIGREAVGLDFHSISCDLLGQKITRDFLIARLEKDRLATVAALSDMVRRVGDDYPGQTGHDTS